MPFSKAVFLSSLTCFTLGIGSAFAACGTTDCDSNHKDCYNGTTNYSTAISDINSNGPGVIYFTDSTLTTSSVPALEHSACLISQNASGTEFQGSGSIRYIYVDTNVTTIGPSSSDYSSTQFPISFNVGSDGYLQVDGGELVFGPNVIYPSSTSDLGAINVNGASAILEFQKAGTIVTNINLNPGTLNIAVENVVTFSGSTVNFSSGSTLSGLSRSSVYSGPYSITGDLDIMNINLVSGTGNKNTTEPANINMRGNCQLQGGGSSGNVLSLGPDTSITLFGTDNYIISQSGVTFTIDGNILGSGGWIFNGGNVILEGINNTYSGGTTVNTGILSISGNQLGTGAVTIGSSGTLKVTETATITPNMTVNVGTISIPSEDVVTFSGDLAFTDGSAIEGASTDTAFVASKGFALTDTVTAKNVNIVLGGDITGTGTLALGTTASDTIQLQGGGGSGTTTSVASTIDVDLYTGNNTILAQNGNTLYINGPIWGTSGHPLTVGTSGGTGEVILTNSSNNYQSLYVNGGTLSITGSSIGNNGTIYIRSGATLSIQTALTEIYPIQNTEGTFNISADVTLSGTFTSTSGRITANGSTLILGDLAGTDLSITDISDTAPSIKLTGSASGFSGELSLQHLLFYADGASTDLENADVSLKSYAQFIVNTGFSAEVRSLTDDTTGVIKIFGDNLTIGQPNATSSLNGAGGSAIISGTGSLTYQLSGGNTACTVTPNGLNTYTGATIINTGITLNLSSTGDASTPGNLGQGTSLQINGGTLSLGSNVTELARDTTLGTGGGTIVLQGSTPVTLSGAVSGTGPLTVTGDSGAPGTLILTEANSYSGGTLLNDVTLEVANTGYLGTDLALTLSSGVLEIGTSATLDSSVVIEPAGGTLSVPAGNTLTVSGNISGSGDISFPGGASVVLSGPSNTHTGNVTFVGPQLTIHSNGSEPDSAVISLSALTATSSLTLSLQGDITSTRDLTLAAGEIVFDVGSGFTAAFSGTATLTSDLTALSKTGDGTFSITPSSSNSQIKTSTISAGSMVSNAALLGGSSIEISSGASLTFSETGTGSYDGNGAGTISGPGSVTITGGGTLNMLVPASTSIAQEVSTYSGGTTLLSGILAISSDGALGSTASTLTCSGGTLRTVLISGQSSNALTSERLVSLTTATTFNTDTKTKLTLNGVVSGAQDLTKTGEGELVLGGINLYTGDTSVAEGILNIAGSIPGDVTVDKGAVLKGAGDVGGDVIVTGGIAGGGSIGVLEIDGDLEYEAGSIFFEEFNSSGDASLIDVGGDVTIDPSAVLVVVPQKGTYTEVLTFTALEAIGDLTGEFLEARAPSVTYMKVDYTADSSISVTVNPLLITLTGAGNNANAVATTLNEVIVWNRENVDFVIPGLDVLKEGKLEQVLASLLPIHDTSAMNTAIDQLHPAALKDLTVLQENASIGVQETLSTRLNEEMETLDCVKERYSYTVWMNGMGSDISQDNNSYKGSPQSGYYSTMAGFTAGADYRFIDSLYAGALGGYTSSNMKIKKGRGSGDVHTGYFGLYLGAVREGYFANISVTGGWSGYNGSRHIKYGDTNVTAKNSHGGRQILSHLEGGLNLPLGRFNLRPFNRFDYLSQKENGYSEKDAGDWNLTVSKSTSILIRNELGLQFASCFFFPGGKITASPKLSWIRETRVSGSKNTAAFTDAKYFPFTVTGYFPNRSLFSPGVVITGAALEDTLSLSAYYDGEFTGGYSAHRYGGEVRYSF